MTGRQSYLLFMCCALLALVVSPRLSSGANWPDRVVTIVVPFGAGGNTDMMARLAAQDLSSKFGQTFVVENHPSAGGALGTRIVANANPDGYTLLFAASSMVTLTPQVQKLDFDPSSQLVPITNVGTGTQILAIKKSLPVQTLPEFLAYAKANPGKLNFTVAGTQNISHLAPVLLFARAGVDLVMVPAHSEPQAVSDLLAGLVDLYFGNASALLPYANNDNIRLIAVGTAQATVCRTRHSDRLRDPVWIRILILERLSGAKQNAGADHQRYQDRGHEVREDAGGFRSFEQAWHRPRRTDGERKRD